MSVVKSPKKGAESNWHRAQIIAALHIAGWSLRALSKANGLSEHTLKTALDTPYLKAERIIASAIGEQPEAIWPERYAKRNFTPVLTPKSNLSSNFATSIKQAA
jgi:Ner family transcriptional regulator